jgi:hypothetical protein
VVLHILWGGGVNIIRFSTEKDKNFVYNRFSGMFNAIIQTYDLREISMFGGGGATLGQITTKTPH